MGTIEAMPHSTMAVEHMGTITIQSPKGQIDETKKQADAVIGGYTGVPDDDTTRLSATVR